MRWRAGRRSDNVVDRRGDSGGSTRAGRRIRMGRMAAGGGGKSRLILIAVVLVIGFAMGKNPMEMLGLLSEVDGGHVGSQQAQSSGRPIPAGDETAEFVAAILGETEDVWDEIFAAAGKRYERPTLNLFSGGVNTACGRASSATGPFYCPGDKDVYLDLSFFEDMKRQLGGGGDFAYAYVIAHEVGHHIQTLLGVSARVNDARRRGQNVEGDGGLLVRQELQADCYAGVWANRSQARHQWLEAGDIEEALNTASAIGDDLLQRQAGRAVVPDAFSHGTSAQRVRWFKIGFENGDPNQCDTFAATRL